MGTKTENLGKGAGISCCNKEFSVFVNFRKQDSASMGREAVKKKKTSWLIKCH